MGTYRIPDKLQEFGKDIKADQLAYHGRRVALTKEFTFDAAHHLHLYDGKCKNLHGHTYRLVVTVSGYVNEIGLVIDFSDLKRIYQTTIEDKLDHQYLNEVLPAMNTSAENMVVWMWEQLERALQVETDASQQIRLEELVLYETPTSRATLKRAWVE
ncbi:6-carboxytetrahydropterin synthase QueD [Alicyclobacillus fastidiosus]|uniref:6-carboxy-5,6,7,8-tetrahydropterin synthase n=1 Tax=Alicyclobacillus fastidiosus TaxID=392011 RepID=A0ABY6ZM16_9BACL|nr:6-carboxytetrahydropterin synthase QueD [Alicyclobacillus fastidiosus]WAH43891.1 6-carboxytetrahydropterin synthase QueD [Alicyclobacillus fastidiosus]GMA60134.1 6-carboxytetrahydropterin synthase QueD [Alicyclobacillus fastidiosus]